VVDHFDGDSTVLGFVEGTCRTRLANDQSAVFTFSRWGIFSPASRIGIPPSAFSPRPSISNPAIPPYAFNGLGAASAKSGDEASAMRHFEAAIEANPHFPEPRLGKALLLKNQGQLDAVAEALESLLRDTSPGDSRSNPVFQRAEQFLASIRKEIRERGGPTNPELLQGKHPAAVWHLLGALKRFDSLDPRRVMEITFEVARLGESGLDYANPEKKYTLSAYPGESFSGLQLMCLMYAGFKRIAPEQDTGMDLNEPWIKASELFNVEKPS